MSIPYTDLKNFVFNIFGNCLHQLNFTAIFQVNNSKYQNILPTAIFANSQTVTYIKHRTKLFLQITKFNYYISKTTFWKTQNFLLEKTFSKNKLVVRNLIHLSIYNHYSFSSFFDLPDLPNFQHLSTYIYKIYYQEKQLTHSFYYEMHENFHNFSKKHGNGKTDAGLKFLTLPSLPHNFFNKFTKITRILDSTKKYIFCKILQFHRKLSCLLWTTAKVNMS